MGPLPFAFSVQHFISSVGADAGFASIIGLAVLVLLYFAQARETATLREQAAEAAKRVAQLEARLGQVSRQPMGSAVPHAGQSSAQPPTSPPSGQVTPPPGGQVTPPPSTRRPATAASRAVPSASPSPSPGQAQSQPHAPVQSSPAQPEPPRATPASVTSSGPGAPAGTGAPPMSAATRLIPGAEAPASRGTQQEESPNEQTIVGSPPPVTPAGGGNGTTGSPLTRQPAPAGIPGPGRTATGAAPRRPAVPRGTQPPSSGRGRRVIAAVVTLLAAALVVVALLVLTSSGGSTSSSTGSSNAASNSPPPPHHASRRSAVSPSSVTVAVLNGTATSGLAHNVAVKLGSGGYKQGTVATAADQTRTATTVAYLPGHRRDAAAVASALKLAPSSVAPVDAGTQAVACPPPAACNATVVVTVGSDLTNLQ